MVDYHELIDDHSRIDALAQKLEHAVHNDGTASSGINAILAELSDVVAMHLRKEAGFVYPDLAVCQDGAGASGLVAEFEILKEDWQTYLAAWQGGMAWRDWAGFRGDTFGMLHRLRQRVAKETSLLYGMALREGLITLQPALAGR